MSYHWAWGGCAEPAAGGLRGRAPMITVRSGLLLEEVIPLEGVHVLGILDGMDPKT